MNETETVELAAAAAPLHDVLLNYMHSRSTVEEFTAAFFGAFELVGGVPSEPVQRELDKLFYSVEDFDEAAGPSDSAVGVDVLRQRVTAFVELVGFG